MKAVIPFLIIGLCIGVYFLYLDPMTTEVKQLAVKRDQYYDILAKTKEITDKRDQIKTQFDSISPEDFAKLDKIIPPTFNPMVFINDVNGIASRNGVVVQNFEVAAGQTADRALPVGQSYQTNGVSFTVIGSYSQFKKFLVDVESSLSLVDITYLDIEPRDPAKPSNDLFSFNMKLNTYSLK